MCLMWITCLVLLCAWWLVTIDESYTCTNIVDDNLWWCLFMNDEILCLFNPIYLFDYDWCEANPQWAVVDCLPICMNG